MTKKWVKECIWYKPPNLITLGKLFSGDIQRRERAYRDFYQEKNGVSFDISMQQVQSDIVQDLIIKSPDVVGIKDGLPVKISKVSKAGSDKSGNASANFGMIHEYTACAPALYVVTIGGKRVDSFLKQTNAKACAARLLAA